MSAATYNKRENPRPSQPDLVIRELTIHLHKYVHGHSFKDRAPRAVKTIRQAAQKMMRTQDVRLDENLNKAVWKQGVRNVPRRIRVRFSRRRNEDDKAKEKYYTLATLVPVASFKGLQTEVVEE